GPACATPEAPMSQALPSLSVAEQLAERIAGIRTGEIPDTALRTCNLLALDIIGLVVAARNQAYAKAALDAWEDDGPCTALGHGRTLPAAGAAFVNGRAAHGEDFDDTLGGGPVHAGAVVVPAVLAACERHDRDGQAALLGVAVGAETLCRLSL